LRRVGIFGWGIVAPRSPTIERFAENLESAESWLEPFGGFGPSNFLVGMPEFDVAAYEPWVDARFPPNRFPQLVEKMDPSALYAVGTFIQALGQNPGLEEELTRLGPAAHVYFGTGLGSLPTLHQASITLHHAQRRWNRFWADPARNSALAEFLAQSAEKRRVAAGVPPDPAAAAAGEREPAEDAWWEYWAFRSPELGRYLAELREIESLRVEGEVEAGKLKVIKEKQRRKAKLRERWEAPDPPWRAVPTNVLWNIPNTPASQVSMLGHVTGLAFAPVAACSTFGVALKLAMDAIDRGEAKAVVVGATDAPPHPLTVGGFYNARVLAADASVSKPLSGLQGTHVSGGAVTWIVGDLEHMTARGFAPLGMEPLAVGVSSDADHIITPSREGPAAAVRAALEKAGVDPGDLGSWDLHATATPGDYLEVETLRGVVPETVLITARKGTFGHGMSAAGGWELTAQYLGYERGRLFPTPLAGGELNPEIARLHDRFLLDGGCPAPPGAAGKLSMGIGGINACVISRPWG
jgi:3-oxoacyl-[acyl-carrier-protein] synthase II